MTIPFGGPSMCLSKTIRSKPCDECCVHHQFPAARKKKPNMTFFNQFWNFFPLLSQLMLQVLYHCMMRLKCVITNCYLTVQPTCCSNAHTQIKNYSFLFPKNSVNCTFQVQYTLAWNTIFGRRGNFQVPAASAINEISPVIFRSIDLWGSRRSHPISNDPSNNKTTRRVS